MRGTPLYYAIFTNQIRAAGAEDKALGLTSFLIELIRFSDSKNCQEIFNSYRANKEVERINLKIHAIVQGERGDNREVPKSEKLIYCQNLKIKTLVEPLLSLPWPGYHQSKVSRIPSVFLH